MPPVSFELLIQQVRCKHAIVQITRFTPPGEADRLRSEVLCLSRISVDESHEIIGVSGALTHFIRSSQVSVGNKATLGSSADLRREARVRNCRSQILISATRL